MPSKKLLFIVMVMAIAISSCQLQYPGSQNTSSNPTATEIFDDRPLPSEFNLDNLKTGTAAAASGPSNTPSVLITVTSTATINPNGPTSTPTLTAQPGAVCATPTCGAGQTLVCPSGNCPNACGLVCSGVTATFTPLTPGAPAPVQVRPATWTLHEGEFPYCIARRFDVDPTELLRLSHLSEGSLYSAGTVLTIPQTGSFPGPRALIPSPATYKVVSSEETFYSIACLYGDPHPQRIAEVNNLPISTVLFIGQTISIPIGFKY